MLPWPSCLSVSNCPEIRLRHWSSLRYLRISLLHRKFQSPLQYSSKAVSSAVSGLSPEISHLTYSAAYAPFTPNESEQRLRPLYYRGCWHRVSRLFLFRYYQTSSSYLEDLFPNDRSLQSEDLHPPRGVAPSGFPPLRKILDCCPRRCLDRVSVPVWLVVLSDQLPVIALVGFYPAD